MTRKWFCTFTIFTIVAVAVFVFDQMTQAQRSGRGERRERWGEERQINATILIDNSWADLTFTVKVDDEILLKARPIYQKHRDNLEKILAKNKEAQESTERQGRLSALRELRGEFAELREEFTKERNALLTEEQLAQLEKIEEKREEQIRERSERLRSR